MKKFLKLYGIIIHGWYRISQNDEVGKLPHRSVFGERLELII